MKINYKKSTIFISFCFVALALCNVSNAQMSDKVLVVVNDDVITQSEFDFRIASINAEFAQTGQTLPDDVSKQLLDSMISERLQIQEAERRGINITDLEVDQAVARFAQQQGQTVAELEQSLGNVGQAVNRFKQTVRDSLTILSLIHI